MAADLYIRLWPEDMDEDDMRAVFSNSLGAKYGPDSILEVIVRGNGMGIDDPRYMKVYGSPGVWIGEVSWLKAALFEDGGDDFIPGPVMALEEWWRETPCPIMLDEPTIEKIIELISKGNDTSYSVCHPDNVRTWLGHNKDRRILITSE